MRVLQVVNRLGMGGTEYGVLKIMFGMDGERFDQRLCAVRGVGAEMTDSPGLEGKVCALSNQETGSQIAILRLVRLMKKFQPDIVHSRNWGAIEAVPAARLAGVPVAIHSEHGYELEMCEGLPWRRRVIRRAVYAMADAVFTVTRDLRDYHARQAWVSSQRIRVIYNGVDTRRFAACPQMRAQGRRELGIPSESIVVGTVGRVVPIKDHATLLKAAEILIRRGRDVRVLLVGAGPDLAGHQSYAESSRELSGRVIFAGASEEVHKLLNVMDIFVLPSIREGMSNTVLEAMATGLPVVATRCGGNPELIEEARTGWLFTPGEREELAGRLEAFVADGQLRRRCGAAARGRALDEFQLERMVGDYEALYLELAERRGVRLSAG